MTAAEANGGGQGAGGTNNEKHGDAAIPFLHHLETPFSLILHAFPCKQPAMIAKEIDDSAEYSGEGHSERHSASPASTVDAPATQSLAVDGNEKVIAVEAEAPPDGGFKAWTQVIGSFFLFFNSWHVSHRILFCFPSQGEKSKSPTNLANTDGTRGLINAFGVYQTYYEIGFLSNQSPSNISWIGSIQAFLLMIVGAVTGPLYDAGYFYYLISTGSFLVTFGLMMTSLCTEYWQVMLAQAICIGLGCGCIFVPSIAILPQYFAKRKAFATGIAASGSGLGE